MDECKDKKPEWTPEGAGPEFASFVAEGVPGPDAVRLRKRVKRRELTVDDYVDGVLEGNRTILARAITLIESQSPSHLETGLEVLQQLLPHSGKSKRVGITGVPGAGKSTFVESLGFQLCEEGHQVAVLAIDPSSSLSGGSILGDKTRMEKLANHSSAFIRPSPTGGNLGGVAEKSRSTMILCEAAGYDVVLVETVGVGQNETTVRGMVDCFLLLSIAGAGDDLQGIKKGVVEIADLFVVNKADGNNKTRAARSRSEMETVLHYLNPFTPSWTVPALTCSAMMGHGVKDVWDKVISFFEHLDKEDILNRRRSEQNVDWMHEMIFQEIRHRFFLNDRVAKDLKGIEKDVYEQNLPPYLGAKTLLEKFLN
ncbi:MAG: methylmalonyl Co-A mutase-associated GTPase MeaB [Opitutales bacterium]|nr:methylmalonyl Co-A mutase-associated GTPase MeaB [Opitutales bacterium]